MKKRMTGVLLAVCLCLTLLPTGVFAAYEPPTEVGNVAVSVTAPTVGSAIAASEPTVEAGQPYFLDSGSWTRVAAEGCAANVDGWGSGGETFADGSWYLLSARLLLDYGYVYAESVTAAVPGAERIEVRRYRDDSVFVSAWFKVGSPAAAANIDSVSVSDIPTERRDKVGDWTDAIQKAAVSENCRISYASLYEWDSKDNYWSACYSSDTTDGAKIYGTRLTVNTTPGHVFTDSTTVTVSGGNAEIVERSMDELKVFVPFGNVTVSSVEVESDTWPIDGNTIRKDAENFSIDAEYLGYTLESARFQIKDAGGEYRDLNGNETRFSGYSDYRVIAVLKARDYASFADSVTGDFNGKSGVTCEISDGGKTCTVTRGCAVYDPVYTYPANNPNNHINGVDIYRPDPKAGEKRVLGEFAPTAGQVRLAGANANTGWYEVPYVGSTTRLKTLGADDTFEAGKIYLSTLRLSNQDGYRFGEGFTVSFRQPDGSLSNYALMDCTRDSAREKEYSIWYTVGEVTQQAITQVAITGPEPENGTIDTSDLSKFQAGGVTVTSASYYSYGYLNLTLQPRSGHYFGRTVTVTYNGKSAEVSDSFLSGQRFDVKYARVNYNDTPAVDVTVSGITAMGRAYDGTTVAALTGGTLDGVAEGDDVSLDMTGVTAAFADGNVGTAKPVTVTGKPGLTGADAGKYTLIQPDLSGLTADITPCESFTDATERNQTIRVGGSSFSEPRFTGVTVGGSAEAVDGDVVYTLERNTAEPADIAAALKELKAGEKLEIGYTFTAKGTYKGTAKGTVTVTAQEYTGGSSGSQSYAVNVTAAEHGSVTADRRYAGRGDTVTITVKPDSGYVLKTVTVTDVNGNELELTDKGNGTYTFTMPSGRVEVRAGFAEDNGAQGLFADVPADSYYYDAVRWAVEADITGGVGGGLFAPDSACTRAQAVTFLWRAAGSPTVESTGGFADVAGDSYYAQAVAWAVKNGITDGTGPELFSPDADCTRAQIAAFLYRYMQSRGEGFTGAWMFQLPFTDVPEWCYEAVAWCYMKGVTDGTSAATFSPDADCTRAQILTFLYRCMG